jgi:hypothetical protein
MHPYWLDDDKSYIFFLKALQYSIQWLHEHQSLSISFKIFGISTNKQERFQKQEIWK